MDGHEDLGPNWLLVWGLVILVVTAVILGLIALILTQPRY